MASTPRSTELSASTILSPLQTYKTYKTCRKKPLPEAERFFISLQLHVLHIVLFYHFPNKRFQLFIRKRDIGLRGDAGDLSRFDLLDVFALFFVALDGNV